MRVLHYLHRIQIADGGVVRAVLDMCTHQARAGVDVTLATYDDSDVPPAWKKGGPGLPKVVRVNPPGAMKGFAPAFARQFNDLVGAADVVHLHVIWDPSILAVASTARRLKKPYIISPHGMLADWSVVQKKLKKDMYNALFGRRLIDGASFICTTARGELDQSAPRHTKTPGVVIPLLFDLDPYKNPPGPGPAREGLKLPPDDVPTLLYLSRLHYKKRPDLLIAAAGELAKAGKRFNVLIGGPSDPAYSRGLEEFAKQCGVADRVRLLGLVPQELKTSTYQAADIFVLPTSMENFGFVYFEALASGTPVVTTKGTDTWPEIEGSGGGRIVEMIKSDVKDGGVGGGDVRQLASVLGALIDERHKLKAMGQAGRQWVLDNLDPDRIVAQYIDLYKRAIGSR